MLKLAIDCALRRINLGAADGEDFLGELSVDAGTRQSELLPGAARDFLMMFGLTVRDIGHIAVTTGPGYFTGIRVGLSYAAALAESVGALVSGVSTLRAMALPLMEALAAQDAFSVVAPIIPAGRDSFYAAMYGVQPGITTGGDILLGPSHIGTEELLDCLKARADSGGVVVTGYVPDGALEKKSLRAVPPPSVARGVFMAARLESPADPSEIRAVYLRRPC